MHQSSRLKPGELKHKVRHILCAVDGSSASLSAMAIATQTAKGLGAQLTAVWACAAGSVGSTPSQRPPLCAAVPVLESAARIAIRHGYEGVRTVQITGRDVASVISDYAEANDVDLILAGSTGLTGAERTVFGSTAIALLRHSLVPVSIV